MMFYQNKFDIIVIVIRVKLERRILYVNRKLIIEKLLTNLLFNIFC